MTDAVDSREQAGQDRHKEQCLMMTIDRLEEDALRTDDTDSSVGVFQVCNAVFAANRLVIGSGRQQARGLGHGWRHGSGRMCVPCFSTVVPTGLGIGWQRTPARSTTAAARWLPRKPTT